MPRRGSPPGPGSLREGVNHSDLSILAHITEGASLSSIATPVAFLFFLFSLTNLEALPIIYINNIKVFSNI